MALTTKGINVETKTLEEGYEIVVDEQGRRSLKKIRTAEKKVSKKSAKKE